MNHLLCSGVVQARGLRDFLLPMLDFLPEKRATAEAMLEHPWLEGKLPQGNSPHPATGASPSRGGDHAPSTSRSASPQKHSRCVGDKAEGDFGRCKQRRIPRQVQEVVCNALQVVVSLTIILGRPQSP